MMMANRITCSCLQNDQKHQKQINQKISDLQTTVGISLKLQRQSHAFDYLNYQSERQH